MESIKNNPAGIGYIRYNARFPTDSLKVLPLAPGNSNAAVEFTIDNVQSATYPLHAQMSFWMSVAPGAKLDPKIKEFLRYVLSRQAQEQVQTVDRKYLPLTASIVAAERAKLDRL